VNRKDPLEYYSLLGVSPTASDVEIKTAFRKRAKDLHPDRNPSSHAVLQFQRLGKAYEVLSNPDARARYDTWYVESSRESISDQQTQIEPIVCSCCGTITAQPRYAIFYQVTSFIAVTIRSPIQGIFCPSCAEGKVLRGTIITWFVGWWGLPWGVLYSLHAIIHNLLGGSKPDDVNARLLIHQAYFFATQNKLNLAHAIAIEAKTLASRVSTNDGFELRNLADKLLNALEKATPVERLQNAWSVPNRPFYWQSAILAAVVLTVSSVLQTQPRTLSSLPSNVTNNSPAPSSSATPQYVRPSSADNGVPFPVASNYVSGYPQQFIEPI
jgi:DnaJ domain